MIRLKITKTRQGLFVYYGSVICAIPPCFIFYWSPLLDFYMSPATVMVIPLSLFRRWLDKGMVYYEERQDYTRAAEIEKCRYYIEQYAGG